MRQSFRRPSWSSVLLVVASSAAACAAPQRPATSRAADAVGAQAAEAPPRAQGSGDAPANDSEALAKKLSNPVASLISVPFQANRDGDFGVDDRGTKAVVNVQPVIPFSLNDDWNLITRTIVPIAWQEDIVPGRDQFGLGDVLQSDFFSPVKPTENGWIWGAGPAFLLPTATNEFLGGRKYGVGPTGVALKQVGQWTVGALANHLWSVAGDEDRRDVNATFVQPFVSFTTKTATTFTANTESTYDWESHKWSVPLNGVVSQLVRIGGMPVSLFAGVRWWAQSPDAGPEGLGARFGITLLFPR